MKFVERKDLDKAKCNFCNNQGKYITKIPYPLLISYDEGYDSGMRIRVCVCSNCLKKLYNMNIRF